MITAESGRSRLLSPRTTLPSFKPEELVLSELSSLVILGTASEEYCHSKSGISCRAHLEPKQELKCNGPCVKFKVLDDFSNSARRAADKDRVSICTNISS